jgi:hypothetical protein
VSHVGIYFKKPLLVKFFLGQEALKELHMEKLIPLAKSIEAFGVTIKMVLVVQIRTLPLYNIDSKFRIGLPYYSTKWHSHSKLN